MKGRCSSCKHWEYIPHLLWDWYSDDHKICAIASMDKSNGFFGASCVSESIDGELATRGDFGCVLYERQNG